MAEILVICPNHGIVRRVEMACMWLGRPPMPETDYAFCPMCGCKTIIEYPKDAHASHCWSYTQKDENECKEREIDYYKKKHKEEFEKILER